MSRSNFEPDELDFLAQAGFSPESNACPPPGELIAAQSDALDAETKTLINAHLKACEHCRILLRDLTEPDQLSLKPDEQARIRARVAFGGGFQDAALTRKPAWFWRPAPLATAAVAAIVVIVLGVQFSNRPPTETSVSSPSPSPAPAAPSILQVAKAPIRLPAAVLLFRGDEKEGEYGEQLAEALKPYSADDFAGTVRLLEPVVTKFPKEPEGQFYLGVALLLLGRDHEAVAPFERARSLAQGALGRDASWYLGLAYSKTGNPKQAVAELELLCKSEGEHQADACQGVQELSSSIGR